MNSLKWIALSAALVLGTSAFVVAEHSEEKSTETVVKKDRKEKAAKSYKIVKPYSMLSSLTEEQKAKIDEIHRAALEEQKKIAAKEKEDIAAVLTEDQKKELATLDDKEIAARKEKMAAKEKEAQAAKEKEKAGKQD